MTNYIIRRLTQGVLVLLLVSIFIFLVMRLLPGDPLTLFLAQTEIDKSSPEDIAALRHEYALDKTLPMQYIDWVGGVLHGDLGTSIFMGQNVTRLIAARLPVTFHLGILAMVISSVFGIFFGVVCGIKRGKWIDTFLTVIANIGITAPSFWVGILLIYFLSLKLHWLPVYGYTSPIENFWLSTRQVIMPVFCLSLFSIASLTRQTRSSTLEVVRQDYIRTAWAKGLTEKIVVLRHILKNALIPVVTMLGMQVSLIVGGSVLIETIFNIPGVGRLMRDAVISHDYQIVQSGILIISTVVVLSNLLVDISYGWFDPRIRYT
jgi:peptide/nickel transport system permease protein